MKKSTCKETKKRAKSYKRAEKKPSQRKKATNWEVLPILGKKPPKKTTSK